MATSAIRPDDVTDPSGPVLEISAEQLAAMPADQVAEIKKRQGAAWVRGFAYAPESHEAAALRGACDFTSMDTPPLAVPGGLTVKEEAGKGTIAVGKKLEYVITAIDPNGQTKGSVAVKLTMAAEGAALLKWAKVEAGSVEYGVYGRVEGELLLITVVGPFDDLQACEFLDNGSKAPKAGKTVPAANTTGGTGHYYSNLESVVYVPPLAIAGDRCSSFGFEARDFKGRATRLLQNATPQAMEYELWEGKIAQKEGYPNNYLANAATTTIVTPTAVPSVARGTQILQDALQQCGFGGQGMIHVQAQTAPNLLGARRVGPMFYDIYDNIVVPGVGYTGYGPGNEKPAEGVAWMYATDLVMVRESDIQVFPDTFSEALDRGQGGFPNTITFRAERFTAAYFDGACHFACKVNLAT